MGIRRFLKNFLYKNKYEVLVKKLISLDNIVYATFKKNCDELKKIIKNWY